MSMRRGGVCSRRPSVNIWPSRSSPVNRHSLGEQNRRVRIQQMLFNSFSYLVFFAVVMVGAKLLINRRAQHLFLLIASIYFYAAWNTYLVGLILASAAVDYFIALRMSATASPNRRRC